MALAKFRKIISGGKKRPTEDLSSSNQKNKAKDQPTDGSE